MKYEIKITSLLVLLVSTYASFAQTLSNKGKEFWVGYGHHQFMEPNTKGGPQDGQEMVLYFSSSTDTAHVAVTINGTTYVEEYVVPPNTVVASKLIPKGLASGSLYDARLYTKTSDWPGGTNSEGIFKKHGIHIKSDVPIVAYAHIYGYQASGATMLMPVETWGYSYVSMNSRQIMRTNGARDCFSWVYVVAKENNTRVRIIPTVNTRSGRMANVPFEVDLQKGEIYQLLGASITDDEGNDLTGTSITSIANAQGECYPIAVFSGSSRTAIICTENDGGGDYLIQQIFPYQAWGKRYLTAPTSTDASPAVNNINIYRIIVRDPTTIVKKNGQQLFGIRGFYYEYQTNQADYIEADKPIQVAQYIPSQGYCSSIGQGDPELMVISPLEQAIKQVGFYRNTKEKIDVNYLTLIIPTAGVNSLTIDGLRNDFSYSYPHPKMPGYTVVIKKWKSEQKQCIVQSDSAFTGITYGIGSVETYGYNIGTHINNLNGVPEIKNTYNTNTTSNKYTCVNTPMQLSVLMRYQPTKMQWKLSELAGKLSPAADIMDLAPVASGTLVMNGITYYKYTLPQTYIFNAPGFYKVPLITTHPTVETCNNSEEIPYEVEVKAALHSDFDIAFNNCNASAQISFSGKDKFENGDSVAKWNWSFPNSNLASGKTVQQLFQAGEHEVKLQAISKEGCVADTTKRFKLLDKPKLPEFVFKANQSCVGSPFTFVEANPEAGIKLRYWDFGNNDTLTTTSNDPQLRTFSNYGVVNAKHVVVLDNGCISDTATQVVTIYAKPSLSFQYPTSCLLDGVVPFKNTTTAPDGQAIDPNGYSWNFGDDQASPANPNTSTLAEPSHTFRFGTYEIKYSATTVNGCTKDSLFKAIFNIKPQLTYTALDNVCESLVGNVSVAKAVNTNGVAGTGMYRGIATDTVGSFTPSKAGPGTHTIWFVYSSAGGCTDSVSQTITVYPQPVIDAGSSFVVPQGTLIRFESRATDSSRLAYSWSPAIGLSNSTVLRPSLIPLHDQRYTVTATNEHNCTASDFLTVTILKTLTVPNVFSPNGDGINDRWEIANLADYANGTIQVFNRYGQLVYSSVGYATPWDGRHNGKPLSMGTYYYVIDRKNGFEPVSGSVTILR